MHQAATGGIVLGLLCLGLGLSPARADDPTVFEDPPPEIEAPVATPSEAPPADDQLDLEGLYPPSGKVFGWRRMAEESTGFGPLSFDEYLGPGVGLYVEYGLREIRSLDYDLTNQEGATHIVYDPEQGGFREEPLELAPSGPAEITIELFRMRDANGAFGLYSIFNALGNETPELTNIDADEPAGQPRQDVKTGKVRVKDAYVPPMRSNEYRIYPGQGAEFYKSDIYGRIRVYGNINDTHMLGFTTYILNGIPKAASKPKLLRALPQTGKLGNSERYVVGPISAQELNFPVPPSIWGLSGSSEAATARYRYSRGGNIYDVVVVEYANPQWARSKYEAVVGFFDSDPQMQQYPADPGIPGPFAVAQDLKTDLFVGIRLDGKRILMYSNVPNAPLFRPILQTGGNIVVSPGGG